MFCGHLIQARELFNRWIRGLLATHVLASVPNLDDSNCKADVSAMQNNRVPHSFHEASVEYGVAAAWNARAVPEACLQGADSQRCMNETCRVVLLLTAYVCQRILSSKDSSLQVFEELSTCVQSQKGI